MKDSGPEGFGKRDAWDKGVMCYLVAPLLRESQQGFEL